MITGRCNCGSIEYQFDMPEDKALSGIACHCKSCTTSSSGSSFNIPAQLSDLKVTKGNPKVFEDKTSKSGKTVHRNFCGECGSALWSSPDAMPGVTFAKVGPLSVADKVSLDTEIFCEYAAPNTLRANAKHLDAQQKPWKGNN